MKLTLDAKSSKKAFANGLLSTVMRMFGYCVANEYTTGTVIATSPIAENLIIKICSVFIQGFLLQ